MRERTYWIHIESGVREDILSNNFCADVNNV